MNHYIVRKAAELLGISEKTLRTYSRAIEVYPQPYAANGKYKVYSEEQITRLRAHRDHVRLVEQGIFDPDAPTAVPLVLAQKSGAVGHAPVFTPFRATGTYIEPPPDVVSTQSWCKVHGLSPATFWKHQDKALRVLRPPEGQQFLRKGRRFTIGINQQMQHAAWLFFHEGTHGAFFNCADCPHEAN